MLVAYFGKKDVERSPPLYGCWQLTQQLCILCILIIDNNQFKEKRTLIVLPDSQLVTYLKPLQDIQYVQHNFIWIASIIY